MAKYDPLAEYLRRTGSEVVAVSFDDLDLMVGGLPASARSNRTWWGNTVSPRNVQAAGWIAAGRVVRSVDLARQSVVFVSGSPVTRPQPKSRRDVPDGASRLAEVLRRAGYESTLSAVAAHVTMLDPTVVEQTNGGAVFATVRRDTRVAAESVGSFGDVHGAPVMFDDNRSPTVAFLWATGTSKPGRDMQYNHLWPSSRDRHAYTALWNVCATPAFLAKTTDGRNHPDVVAALRRRSFDLYGRLPAGVPEPVAPAGYDGLEWAPHPHPIRDLEGAYRREMSTKPLDRVVGSARHIGWLFSDWQPDGSL